MTSMAEDDNSSPRERDDKTLQTPFEEAISVEISSQSYTFKTLVIYNKHRTNKTQFIELLEEYLQCNTSATTTFTVCGDFRRGNSDKISRI